MGLLDFLPFIGKIFDRVLPDPTAAADAKLKVMTLVQEGQLAELNADLQAVLGQLEINKAEASNASLFVAGWRPFVGWVCGAAFAYKFVFAPFIVMLLQMFGKEIDLPTLEFTEILPVLLGMLGLGTLRTVEKVKGIGSAGS